MKYVKYVLFQKLDFSVWRISHLAYCEIRQGILLDIRLPPASIFGVYIHPTIGRVRSKLKHAGTLVTLVIDAPVIDAGTAVQRVRHALWTICS